MKFTAILLDLDDTLLDFGAAEKVALSKTLQELGIAPTEAKLQRYHEINISQWEAFERGELSRERVLIRRFELFFEELGLQIDAQACEDRYRHYLGVGHYFIEGAEALLDYLSPKYKLYLASNGVAETQYSRLESAGIGHYFEEIFISETTGHHKPEREYFDYCFARISGFDPDTTLIIGDSLSSDILGGRNAGIHTCWCNIKRRPARSDIVPDFEIHSLAELYDIL
jgi:2-haloacid dehalogenase